MTDDGARLERDLDSARLRARAVTPEAVKLERTTPDGAREVITMAAMTGPFEKALASLHRPAIRRVPAAPRHRRRNRSACATFLHVTRRNRAQSCDHRIRGSDLAMQGARRSRAPTLVREEKAIGPS
jgi:hypothetical protein